MGRLKEAAGARVRGEVVVATGVVVRFTLGFVLVVAVLLALGVAVGSGRLSDLSPPPVSPAPTDADGTAGGAR